MCAKSLRTMADKKNFNNILQKKDEAKKMLLQVCPKISHRSGIYFLTRKDDLDGKWYGYIGKSETSVLDRMCSHLIGYQQRIDISLKKRGFHSELNPSGWKLVVSYYPKSEVDRWERLWIEKYREAGYILYNIESGGTNGKTIIGERKPPKNYRDGLAQGRKALAKELSHIIDTHLEISLKKDTKVSQKALQKFYDLLKGE